MKGLHYVATAKGLHAALASARARGALDKPWLACWLACCQEIALAMRLDGAACKRFLAICKNGKET